MPIEVVEVIEFPIQPPEVNIAASDMGALQQGIASHSDLQTYNRYENTIQTQEANAEQLSREIGSIDKRLEVLDGKRGNDGALEDARREVAEVADATLNPHWVIKTPHNGEVDTITDVVRREKETLQRDLEAKSQGLTTIDEEIKSQQALMSHYQELVEKTDQEILALMATLDDECDASNVTASHTPSDELPEQARPLILRATPSSPYRRQHQRRATRGLRSHSSNLPVRSSGTALYRSHSTVSLDTPVTNISARPSDIFTHLPRKYPFWFPRRPPDIVGSIIHIQSQEENSSMTWSFLRRLCDTVWIARSDPHAHGRH
jgi:hypothetical protein